ncbi:hypothetical protein PpBr36_02946 [Pyricularia pennisetigena]|uniref:hypothetical protein n=1 Tax=Pyricularia pennisetigena TaxID=1578925 RepID=UPI001154B55F|nr:hypothetical protein PpBr36_02946 [Pyricularia pennisetigena]TLS30369.1 hypothetical protein PpBr36_02946 [Pyricularia pennisetigena]
MASRWNLRARTPSQQARNRPWQGSGIDHVFLSESESTHDHNGLSSSGDEHMQGGSGDSEQEQYDEEQFAQRVPSHNPEDEFSSPPGSEFSPEPDGSQDGSEDLSGAEQALHQLELTDLPEKPLKRSRLKRSRSETVHSTDQLDVAPRPFKRVKGAINYQYIGMLNADIRDACDLHVPHLWPALPASQIGLTFWDPDEKHFFFEALGRLGKHRPHLIAQRVGTKSEMEVRQYIQLLEHGKMQRKRAGQLEVLAAHEIPAAVELSQECVAALENAADAISLRQEAHEETSQHRRRPNRPFLITSENNADLVEEAKMEADEADPLYFFKVENWLELSACLFMNAAYEEGNWQSISHEPPSIRLDTLGDFYSLARAITRKLVAEAIFNAKASNRGRARRAGSLTVRPSHIPSPDQVEVKKQLAGRELFFAGCARRLRLMVVDDDEPDIGQDEAGPAAMSYDEVESKLSNKLRAKHEAKEDPSEMMADTYSSDDELQDSEVNDGEAPQELDVNDEGPSPVADHASEDQWEQSDNSISSVDIEDSDVEVEIEADEVLIHSALGLPADTRSKNALRLRIRAELEREELANAVDRRAGYVEERRIWDEVLGRKPTVALQKVPEVTLRPDTAAATQRRKLAVEDLIPL